LRMFSSSLLSPGRPNASALLLNDAFGPALAVLNAQRNAARWRLAALVSSGTCRRPRRPPPRLRQHPRRRRRPRCPRAWQTCGERDVSARDTHFPARRRRFDAGALLNAPPRVRARSDDCYSLP
jgi:hypothetical protein